MDIKNTYSSQGSSIKVNKANPIVSAIYSTYDVLQAVSPFHGVFFWQIFSVIEANIKQILMRFAQSLQFEEKQETKGNVTLQGITLNAGVIIYAEFPNLPTEGSEVSSTAQFVAPDLDDAIDSFVRVIDSAHDTE